MGQHTTLLAGHLEEGHVFLKIYHTYTGCGNWGDSPVSLAEDRTSGCRKARSSLPPVRGGPYWPVASGRDKQEPRTPGRLAPQSANVSAAIFALKPPQGADSPKGGCCKKCREQLSMTSSGRATGCPSRTQSGRWLGMLARIPGTQIAYST